jgi:membrane-associated phospholipid phosphatase
MPLPAGWNLPVGIVVFSATRNPLLRALALLAPGAMMVSAVVAANHFILDVVAGSAIALDCLIARDRIHVRHAEPATLELGQRRSRPGDLPR